MKKSKYGNHGVPENVEKYILSRNFTPEECQKIAQRRAKTSMCQSKSWESKKADFMVGALCIELVVGILFAAFASGK